MHIIHYVQLVDLDPMVEYGLSLLTIREETHALGEDVSVGDDDVQPTLHR